MEDFVTEIKNNLGDPVEEKVSRFRELLSIMLDPKLPKPEVKIIDKCTKDGDVIFEVPMRPLGLTWEVFEKYKRELSSNFVADFLGELLIRENINIFADVLMELRDKYIQVVNQYEHKQFGMSSHRDKLVFTFHVSLIQYILNEGMRKQLR